MTILFFAQVVVGVLMSVSILLQQGGAGMGAGFGFGGGNAVAITRRGVDLFLHKSTIILAIIFFGLSLAQLILA
jgi:preprotein translocase subunit SecG